MHTKYLIPWYSFFFRNSFGPSYLFANVRTPIGKALKAFLSGKKAGLDGLLTKGEGLKKGEVLLSSEVRVDGR